MKIIEFKDENDHAVFINVDNIVKVVQRSVEDTWIIRCRDGVEANVKCSIENMRRALSYNNSYIGVWAND